MTSSKLINYTTREFMSDHELEQYIVKQNEIFTPKVVGSRGIVVHEFSSEEFK